ncbi:Voltage-dependent anion channel [uncultured archaeon]|nr:Voltage-dependent anion channel [uncultured archaeon]
MKNLIIKWKESLKNEAGSLYPGYFAFVMATGIVSIASYLQGMFLLSSALFSINKVAYVVLWFITLIRLRRYFPRFISDLTSHVHGPGFFTLVAGTCILGNQFVLISQDFTAAFSLLAIGTILWLILIYSFFTAVIVRESKPALETGIHGGWFIAVVATQSVSVLGALVTSGFPAWTESFLFLSLLLYLFGCMLYLIIITLVFYRLAFYKLHRKRSRHFTGWTWAQPPLQRLQEGGLSLPLLIGHSWAIFFHSSKDLPCYSGQQRHGGYPSC